MWRNVGAGNRHKAEALNSRVRHCLIHGYILWPKARVRPIRFHDLWYTTASLLTLAGANPAAVQKILRHSDPRITMAVHAHLAPNYLKDEVNRLSFFFFGGTEGVVAAIGTDPLDGTAVGQPPPDTSMRAALAPGMALR